MVTSKEKMNKEESKTESQGAGRSLATPRQDEMTHFGGYDPFLRWFDQFLPGWPSFREMGRHQGWGLDVQEDESAVHVRAEAPGFEPGEFDVQVHGDHLVMCACHEDKAESDGGKQWQHHEFKRSIMLPQAIDAEHVEAEYRNGILSVKVPKTGESKGRKIAVKG
jgi:HSP20 family protein